MKCPKCEYLGFETSDRCRNCGYDFSLAQEPAPVLFDLPIDSDTTEPLIASPDATPAGARPRLDLDRLIGGPPEDLPLFPPSRGDFDAVITTPSRPRAPLSVRRTTAEIPRARAKTPRPSDESLFEQPPAAVLGHHAPVRNTSAARGETHADGDVPATALTRIMAALLDFSLMSALDGAVLYFTLRLLGLTSAAMLELPLVPLAAFFLLLNGGYFVAFTAVGGQSIGKMALSIKVVGREDESVPIGRATLRTFAYLVSALPLGAGFLPGVIGAERLAFHDRLAHTRVVQLT
jgi:uncharacterized RDD family membrane protein YckC